MGVEQDRLGPSDTLENDPFAPWVVEEGGTSVVFRTSAFPVSYVYHAAIQEHFVLRGPRTFSGIVREYAVDDRRGVRQDFDSFSEKRVDPGWYKQGPDPQQTLKRDQKTAQEAPETETCHQA